MDNKNKFNTVKIATCNDAHKAEAVNQLFERSLLFNRSDDICGIVISKNDEKQFIPISAIPDNVNIEKREGVVTLVENPVVDSITTKADHNGVDWKSQHKIAETSAERTIILLCTKNIENATNIGVIGGEILEVGEGVYGNYKISLTPTGSGLLIGATTFEQKAALVCAKYNGTYYYGIKFKSTVPANIYFSGWDHFPDGADAPLYTSYNDADLSEIIELGGGDSGGSSGGGMTEAEKVEISAMNTQINTNKSDIADLKTSVAGKSDVGHKHSVSDITGATVNRFETCSTESATAAKTVSITDGTFSLEAGARVSVKFSNANTADTPTLNVANTGAKNIFHKGAQITTGVNKALLAGVCDFIYDGTQWHLIGNYIDTTYSDATQLSAGLMSAADKTKLDDLGKYTKEYKVSAVTSETTKYIKLGEFNPTEGGNISCRITGDDFDDTIDINILGGNFDNTSVCGHYSTKSKRTQGIRISGTISQNIRIYLKISQLTTATVKVAVDKKYQSRISLSDSGLGQNEGVLTDISFSSYNGLFGNLTGNVTGNVTGSSGTAAAILDYNRNTPIKVRWAGTGIDSAEWYPAFNADGSALEPINRTNIHAGTADSATTAGTASKVASAGNNGMWIQGRANAICKTTSAAEDASWKTLASIKTRSGSIEIGNLANEDFIRIVYSSDTDVNAGNNNVSHIMQLFGDAVSFGQKIYANAGIEIPTSQPNSLEDGDIWIQ